MATTALICNSGSTPWPPRHQSATPDRRRGHHGINLQLRIDPVAAMASICNSGSTPWPPWHQSVTPDRRRGHHGINLQLRIDSVASTASICNAGSMPGIPRRQSVTRFCLRGGPGEELAGRAISGVIPVPTFQIPPHPRNRLPSPTFLHCKNPRPSRGVPSMAMDGCPENSGVPAISKARAPFLREIVVVAPADPVEI